MKKAYKFKLKPTVKQRHLLLQAFGNARFIYNWGLQRKKESYEKEGKTIGYNAICKEMTDLKKQEEYSWLNNSAAESLQQSLRNLETAYTNFFRTKQGFPKFKSRKNCRDSVKFVNNIKFDFENLRVNIARVGKVKFCKNQIIPDDCKIGTLTVYRDNCGDIWCTVITDDGQPEKSKAKISEDTAVGIDLGIKDYAILSDGTKYGNPAFLEKGQKRLAGLQRGLSRKTKGSRNYEKLRLRIAREHRKITNRRSDFLHKLSSSLINNYDSICLEDLNVEGMLEHGSHKLSNSISSAAWSEFRRQIEYKADIYGKNVLFIDRFEPSSKTCSVCGYIKSDLTLNVREWVCPVCGEHHDRDINAAINIKRAGLTNTYTSCLKHNI